MDQVSPAVLDRKAGSYDLKNASYCEACWTAAQPHLPEMSGRWVLDAGCRTGLITQRIADDVGNWGQVVGMDVSSAMLEHAKGRLGDRRNINLVQASLCEVPGRDRSFDAVMSFHTVRFVEDLSPVLREWRRVLKSDGEVVIMDWDASALPIRLAHTVLRWVDASYKKARTIGEVRQALENHGFSVLAEAHVSASVWQPVWIIRARKG